MIIMLQTETYLQSLQGMQAEINSYLYFIILKKICHSEIRFLTKHLRHVVKPFGFKSSLQFFYHK